jgi:uncharacterized protein YjbI with pentapeptide repeats
LRGNDLESADLRDARADGADFTGANLGRARLSGARLEGAHLVATDLTSARLDQARLVGAGLRQARLGVRPAAEDDDIGVGAYLEDTDLTGADLRRADLSGVVMLRGSLRRARLEQARTGGARWIGVAFRHTRCPDGSRRSTACPGWNVPRTAADEKVALARVAWLRDLPWPWD